MATNPTSALGMQNWYSDSLAQAVAGATDTTIYLNNLPAATEGYLIIDPNTPANREVIHYTGKGSGTVTLPSTGDRGVDGTTAQAHAQGTTVVMNYTTSHFTALQNGYALAANAIATINVVGPTSIPPSGLFTGTGSSWVWQAYTPTFTNLTLGNGTVVGRYTQIGKTVHARGLITLGTTSSVSGNIIVTLPVTSLATNYAAGNVELIGQGSYNRNGTNFFLAHWYWTTTTTMTIVFWNASGTYLTYALNSNTVPATFAATDTITWDITYEAA